MAIISEMEEARPSTLPFTASFEPSNPLGFLEKVFDFVGKESNFLTKATAEKEIVAAVTAAKMRLKEAEKKSKAKLVEMEKLKKDNLKPSDPMEVEKPEEEKEKSGPIVPNKGNGLDFEKYSWAQNLQEVTVTIPVPQGTKSRSVTCEIKRNRIKVGIKGQDPIIDGEFFHTVKTDDCFWNIEDQKVISVLLTKQNQMEWWKYCVKGEPEIDTEKVEPETSRMADLEPDIRASVEKMMFDQRQKQMGRPTSGDIEKEDMMKKFMGQQNKMGFPTSGDIDQQDMLKNLMNQNPGMNFSNAKF